MDAALVVDFFSLTLSLSRKSVCSFTFEKPSELELDVVTGSSVPEATPSLPSVDVFPNSPFLLFSLPIGDDTLRPDTGGFIFVRSLLWPDDGLSGA